MATQVGFEQSGDVSRKLLSQSYDTIVAECTYPAREEMPFRPSQSENLLKPVENLLSKQGKSAGFYDCAPVNIRVSSLRSFARLRGLS